MEKILPTTTNDDEEENSNIRALQIPSPTAKERTALNQKRLLAKYGDDATAVDPSKRSMYHVLWSFSKTRYLTTFFPHLILMGTLLIFPLMLKFTSDSIYQEYVKLNNSKHYETLSVRTNTNYPIIQDNYQLFVSMCRTRTLWLPKSYSWLLLVKMVAQVTKTDQRMALIYLACTYRRWTTSRNTTITVHGIQSCRIVPS